MARTQAMHIVLRHTEAGEYIAKHLDDIRRLLKSIDPGLDLEINPMGDGFSIPLMAEAKAQDAQAIVDQLNNLHDDRGRAVLEAELFFHTVPRKMGRMRVSPHLA